MAGGGGGGGEYGDYSICRAALREAFGDSSDSESDAPAGVSPRPGRGRWRWEAVPGIRGLWLCAAFLSADEQARLLAAIQREGWFMDANNQAMRFGDLPSWATELSTLIREAICVGDVNVDVGAEMTNEDEDACPLPSDLLWREPFFDQMIANRYNPGEGICAHVDLMRFDDGIAIVSLESACVMHFSRAEPRGDARYLWKHEINRKPGAQLWDGRELEQHRRTSVTLRKLLASPS
ncbi:unnamed protein product [Urochloa humidicola]